MPRTLKYSDHPTEKVEGRWLCRWCKKPCPGRRTSWCSDACKDEFFTRASPSYLRFKVFERDRGVCAKCGVDTTKLKRIYERWRRALHPGERYGRWKTDGAEILRTKWGISYGRIYSDWWDANHITAVKDTPEDEVCGVEGIETLCLPCHKVETAAQHRRWAEARYRERTGQESLKLENWETK